MNKIKIKTIRKLESNNNKKKKKKQISIAIIMNGENGKIKLILNQIGVINLNKVIGILIRNNKII